MTGPKTIQRRSTVDVVVDEIRSWIMRGGVEPGGRITEMQLAKDLSIPRSTVRTALLELQKEELVDRRPYSAWTVAEITEEDIAENYTLREALETLAIRVLCRRMGDAECQELTRAFEGLEETQSGKGHMDRPEADLNFHMTIVRLSRHSRLINTYALLSRKVEWIYRWSELRSPGKINLVEWHRPILEALLAGDADAASQALARNYAAAATGDVTNLPSSSAA